MRQRLAGDVFHWLVLAHALFIAQSFKATDDFNLSAGSSQSFGVLQANGTIGNMMKERHASIPDGQKTLVLEKLYGQEASEICPYHVQLGFVGCNSGCACGTLQDCYPRHTDLDGFSTPIDVGVCHYSVPVLCIFSLLIFASSLALVVFVRTCAQEHEEQARLERDHAEAKLNIRVALEHQDQARLERERGSKA